MLRPQPKLSHVNETDSVNAVFSNPSGLAWSSDTGEAGACPTTSVHAEQILAAYELLPSDDPLPGPSREGVSKSFCCGMYSHGGIKALRKFTLQFPNEVRLFCRAIRQVAPDCPFTSITILENSLLAPHKDRLNSDAYNIVVPLTSFREGNIYVEQAGATLQEVAGQFIEAVSADLSKGCHLIDAKNRRRWTQPWEGRRVILVAYCLYGSADLTPQHATALRDLGFHLPDNEPGGEPRNPFVQLDVDLRMTNHLPAHATSDLDDKSAERVGRLSNQPLEELLFIELCSGSGVLSKAMRARGFRAMEVDNSSRRAPGKAVLRLDLSSASDCKAVADLLRASPDTVAMLFAAPPCGTASMAREKAHPFLEKQGFSLPLPLRSGDRPQGLDGLHGRDKLRVEVANQVYQNICELLLLAVSLGIPAALENPENSRFWQTPGALRLMEVPCKLVCYDACAHGGARPKATTLWCSNGLLDSLAVRCDGNHPHESWKPVQKSSSSKSLIFPTSSEAQYPSLFCERFASCLLDWCLKEGALQAKSLKQQRSAPDAPCDRITLGALPRGAKLKPLVAEFGSYIQVVCSLQGSTTLLPFLEQQPKGSRVTNRRVSKWGDLQASEPRTFLDGVPPPNSSDADSWQSVMVEVCTVGIPSSPEDFVSRAVKAGHPRCMDIFLGEAIDEALRDNFIRQPADLAIKRIRFVKHWLLRAKQLEPQEKQLHDSLSEHMKHVLKGKRLLVWSELLDHIGYPDKNLIDDIKQGFRLSGWLSESHVFPKRVRPPENTIEDLKAMSKGLNHSAWARANIKQTDELAASTWEETQAEIQRGWIFQDDIASESDHILAVCFGLEQSNKVRVIDDCRPINRCAGLKEKLKVHSVDRFCALMARAFQLHEAEAEGDFPELLGRTLDLKSAYKQFGVHGSDRDWLRILSFSPESQKVESMGLNSLPFGAVGSVSGFLRVAISVWTLGLRMLSLCWSCYFDDYPCITRAELCKSTEYAMTSLFQLLGVEYAAEGKKAAPFAPLFKMLGLQVSLSQAKLKFIEVGHTKERQVELCRLIELHLARDSISFKDLERLRGRMVFFEGYAFGRVANWAHQVLSHEMRGTQDHVKLGPGIRRALEVLRDRVSCALPLQISSSKLDTWLIFTDGAFEAGVGSVGGILFAPGGHAVEHFGDVVPKEIMQSLMSFSKNPIYELEVMPCLIAALMWRKFLKGVHLVMYLDNEAARTAFLRGSGATDASELLVRRFLQVEMEDQWSVWFARVPTHSNPADSPSRLQFTEAEAIGSVRSHIQWNEVLLEVSPLGDSTVQQQVT